MKSPDGPRSYRSLQDAETLRLLIRSIGEGIYITDDNGRILDCNPAFLEIFGVSSLEEMQRYEVPNLLANQSQRVEEMALLRRDGSVREFELDIIRPDGKRSACHRPGLDTSGSQYIQQSFNLLETAGRRVKVHAEAQAFSTL
jgi:PAS domain S-box-containing protein